MDVLSRALHKSWKVSLQQTNSMLDRKNPDDTKKKKKKKKKKRSKTSQTGKCFNDIVSPPAKPVTRNPIKW